MLLRFPVRQHGISARGFLSGILECELTPQQFASQKCPLKTLPDLFFQLVGRSEPDFSFRGVFWIMRPKVHDLHVHAIGVSEFLVSDQPKSRCYSPDFIGKRFNLLAVFPWYLSIPVVQIEL